MSSELIGKPTDKLRLFYWSETTEADPFETGIQRVVRYLGRFLSYRGVQIVPVGLDSNRRAIRTFHTDDKNGAENTERVRIDDWRECSLSSWLFLPEIPMKAVGAQINPMELGRAYGLRTAAIVHDLIPIKLASQYSDETKRFYERYFPMLASADLIFTTTNYVADDFRRYLKSRGLPVPFIVVSPLPAQFAMTKRRTEKIYPISPEGLRLLTVSTWEPRKNLPRLLRALAVARAKTDKRIHLTVLGRRGGFPTYDAEVEAALSQLADVITIDSVSNNELLALYESHHASVYPSVEEGFGLPILESLWLATPCICHNASSMAEFARGGGTMLIDMTDESAIVDAIGSLVWHTDLLSRLKDEISVRFLESWEDYSANIHAHLIAQEMRASLPSRPSL